MEIHHGAANGASARVLIAAMEKGMAARFLRVDDGWTPPCSSVVPLRLDVEPLPLLVVHGEGYCGATWICSYLEEACAGPSLLPASAHGRWRARAWMKLVDDGVGASVSDLAREALAGVQLGEVSREAARERVTAAMDKAEADLAAAPWLAGSTFSLGDIALYAYAAYLPRLGFVPTRTYQRLHHWLARIAARPGVQAALALGGDANPFAVAGTGPAYVRWG